MKKITTAILAGIIGTAVMSAVMMIGGAMGMPKMSPPKMLSGMMRLPIAVGWVMHLIIGIIFAFAYTFWGNKMLKIGNIWLKGAVFGSIVFSFAQIIMATMPMPPMAGSMLPKVIAGLMGHIIFGIAIALMAGNAYCSKKSCQISQ
ncbi:DUF6789 family protein [Elizabethkingia anophelis]|uniref:DUF6789 family protein n=1 Tax=Elizabethkingia anophelis TaxID=1117645 RepID=UPI0016233ADD|nr:DUF6789 family protein [Elizabethkingia anophelis]MDV4116287.1 hypothetical protein [Elizabethkingia anophelis]